MWHASWMALPIIIILAEVADAFVTIGFDFTPDGAPVPAGGEISTQWATQGVVFTLSDSVSACTATSSNCSYSLPNHIGGDPALLVWFVDPSTGASAVTDYVGSRQDWCWGPGEGIQLEAFDRDGQLIAEEFNGAPGQLVSLGFPEPVIAVLRMTTLGQGVDDLVFSTPVVPTCAPISDLSIMTDGTNVTLQWSPAESCLTYGIHRALAPGAWILADYTTTSTWSEALPDTPATVLYRVTVLP
jgi:hypothetical protein